MTNIEDKLSFRKVFNTTVIVAALGYFVDVYDLLLFLIVGKKSLVDIGVGTTITDAGVLDMFDWLLNVQMIGMLIGGIVWGVLGDKKGRLSVLFGSIIMYSLANIANGFVEYAGPYAIEVYAILRFVAGFGLAGELGAGITLVSEIMHKEHRGYGTMIVASIGVTGAIVAALVGQAGWQVSYFIGGGLGISLLLLRIGVFESGIFEEMEKSDVKKGDFFDLFKTKERTVRYIYTIVIGLPVWYIIGILISKATIYGKAIGVVGLDEKAIQSMSGMAIMLCYSGLILGDIASGVLSQYLKSRKKVFYVFYTLCLVFIFLYLYWFKMPIFVFYSLIFAMGFSVGFWAVFVTVASEQFGSNLRATATTTVPNFVRGSLVPVMIVYKIFVQDDFLGLHNGTVLMTLLVFGISFLAAFKLKETFGKDLDFLEE